ncbi:MAG: hypothetical protein NXI22_18930 [bacterium]|nr:hypothetical protein [bacterium]
MQNEYEPPKTPPSKPAKPVAVTIARGFLAFIALGIASVIAFVATCFPAIYAVEKVNGPGRGHLNFDNAINGTMIAIGIGVLFFVVGSIIMIVRWNTSSGNNDESEASDG